MTTKPAAKRRTLLGAERLTTEQVQVSTPATEGSLGVGLKWAYDRHFGTVGVSETAAHIGGIVRGVFFRRSR